MSSELNGTPKQQNNQALEHLAQAHSLLQDLRNELNQHPKLEDAILRLETALSILTTKTGGLL